MLFLPTALLKISCLFCLLIDKLNFTGCKLYSVQVTLIRLMAVPFLCYYRSFCGMEEDLLSVFKAIYFFFLSFYRL